MWAPQVAGEGVGTLAKIKSWRFAEDDARDGACQMTVQGLRRFRLGRQWEDKCAGCDAPLHLADVSYFNDTEAQIAPSDSSTSGASKTRKSARGGGARRAADPAADAMVLVKDSLRLHYAVTSAEAQRELEERIGETPATRDRGYSMSMWLAAACVASQKACKEQGTRLLATTSTVERLERVIRVQKAQVGKKYGSTTPRRKKG